MRRDSTVSKACLMLLAVALPHAATAAENPADDTVPRQVDVQNAEVSPGRDAGGSEFRDAARLVALIERLDAVRKSADVLPLHALDLSLRKAAELELSEGQAELSRGRALRLQRARIGSGDDGARRDETYRTPVESRVDPADAPPVKQTKSTRRTRSPFAEADLERRRRAVVHELSRLDHVLDEAGLNARRDLLVQLLEVARQLDRHRRQREGAED